MTKLLKLSDRPLSNQVRSIKLIKGLVFLTPIGASFWYQYMGINSPVKCLFLTLTGIPCPGCGLTRSFTAIAGGNIPLALQHHLFGWLLFFSFILAGVHFLVEFMTKRKVLAIYSKLIKKDQIKYTMLGLLLVYHGFRVHSLWSSGQLLEDISNSPLGQILL
ncbi:MAG: DUF2752 domain-containing protein [Synechococcaceae cyanobacterium RL_1_2]|nr:DUF2752 domain-containing protein [Synechococcaceae cyanobacterium RL_1_2]